MCIVSNQQCIIWLTDIGLRCSCRKSMEMRLRMNAPSVSDGSHEYPENVNTYYRKIFIFYIQAKYSIEYIYDADIKR